MEATKIRGTDERIGEGFPASGSGKDQWGTDGDPRGRGAAQPAQKHLPVDTQGWDAFEIWRSRIHTARSGG
jgi:hypothetical protein